jgi:hypothetical protein
MASTSLAGSSKQFDDLLNNLLRKWDPNHYRVQSSELIISSIDTLKGLASKSSADSSNTFDDLLKRP